jgi:hypothetical protein
MSAIFFVRLSFKLSWLPTSWIIAISGLSCASQDNVLSSHPCFAPASIPGRTRDRSKSEAGDNQVKRAGYFIFNVTDNVCYQTKFRD